jgi:hypothetical protein
MVAARLDGAAATATPECAAAWQQGAALALVRGLQRQVWRRHRQQ